MTIQELIAEGRKRDAEAHERIEQMIREAEDTAERKRAAEWSPVLVALRAALPPELAIGIEIPTTDMKATNNITIYVPDTDARIRARWTGTKGWNGKEDINFTFSPTSPQIVDGRDWDAGWYVGMLQDGDWTPDPLIALAQAVDYAEKLPELRAEAEQERQPAQTPEPSTQPVDWLAEAAAGFHDFENTISGMQTAALLAIAQELRRMNDRNDRHDDREYVFVKINT